MSTAELLTSAEAAEVAAFCWPERPWTPEDRSYPSAVYEDQQGYTEEFSLDDFNDLHRASAVLIGHGRGERLMDNLFHECCGGSLLADLVTMVKGGVGVDIGALTDLIKAPAESWARAILATVREVREQASYTPSAQEIVTDDGEEEQ